LNAVRRLGQVRRSHRARPGASGDKIGRADVGGSNVNTAFVTGAGGPRGIVSDGTYLYWANHTSNTVGRSLLNGAGVSQVFVVSASSAAADLLRPAGLAVTGTHVLWSNSDVPKVGRAALTGVVDQLTIFLDGQEVVNNPGSAGVVSAARYYSGSGLLAQRSTVGGLTFVGTDAQGTLTATLTTGGLSTRQRYKPFGEQRGATNVLPSERGFIGQVEDTATGLSYLNARHYDARNGVFVSVDPVLSIYDPVSLNAYIYGGNSPVVFSDPMGLEKGANGEEVSACYKKNGKNTCDGILANPNTSAKAQSAWMANWNSEFIAALNADYADALKDVNGTSLVEIGFQNLVFDYTACKNANWGCAFEVVTSTPLGKGVKLAKRLVNLVDKADDAADALKISKKATKGVGKSCFKSFGGETRVLMGDGTTKPISQVAVGDFVLAQDPETGEVSARRVTDTWVHDDDLVRLEIGGDVVRTTEDHPFWNATDNEWQRADELSVGDSVLTADGRRVKVGVLLGTAGRGSAYNLTIEGLHTYHVLFGGDAVLVHNVDCFDLALKVDGNTGSLILDGAIPSAGAVRKLGQPGLVELRELLKTSVVSRRADLVNPVFSGVEPGHVARLADEERLLKLVEGLIR
jgi:RHS repeat-associated protein